MKVSYAPRTDILSVILKVRLAASDEKKPGIIQDYHSNGDLISLEPSRHFTA
jgi:hypothetical protein